MINDLDIKKMFVFLITDKMSKIYPMEIAWSLYVYFQVLFLPY